MLRRGVTCAAHPNAIGHLQELETPLDYRSRRRLSHSRLELLEEGLHGRRTFTPVPEKLRPSVTVASGKAVEGGDAVIARVPGADERHCQVLAVPHGEPSGLDRHRELAGAV